MDDRPSRACRTLCLIGFEANEIQPYKRPLSSMTPTFMLGADRRAVIGTPGGSRIISMVLLGILDFMRGNEPESWVSLPRFHHQYEPDKISAEPNAFTAEQVEALRARATRWKCARTLGQYTAPWNLRPAPSAARPARVHGPRRSCDDPPSLSAMSTRRSELRQFPSVRSYQGKPQMHKTILSLLLIRSALTLNHPDNSIACRRGWPQVVE
jgi:hypothetical protein